MRKIAVLGGGCGSMAAAFALTEKPGWQDEYEITVYQMGWRLGGKGASGRGDHGRIEEHGLHIWLGFYDNAFGVMQRAYKEMDRPEGAPLREWQDAFKKHSFIVLEERVDDAWRPWPIDFPKNGLLPGPGTPLPTLWDYVGMALRALEGHFKDLLSRHPRFHEPLTFRERMHGIVAEVGLAIDLAAMGVGEAALHIALALHEHMPHNPHEHDAALHEGFIGLLDEFLAWLWKKVEHDLGGDDELRRAFLIADLAFANIRGIIREGILTHREGLDALDKYEYLEFLQKYGAKLATIDAAPLKGLYDLVFGYENGEVAKPNFAAGAALRSVLRIGFGYKGAIFWKMQAGMGDTVFTPLHKVLEKRGVRFAFFQCVRNLGLAEGEDTVETITLGRQATVTAGEFAYDPYVEVQDLACWPSEPNFDQLDEGERLEAEGVNLESFWTTWPDVETRTLRRGVNFDDVVLGISIGSFPYVAPELAHCNDRWKAMVDNVGTVRTQSMQLWLTPTLSELGWPLASPVMDGYADDMNTWADMSHLIPREDFPVPVGCVAYYCGPMVGGVPDQGDAGFPARAKGEALEQGKGWLAVNSGFLWPEAAPPDNPAGLDWSLLVDPDGGAGEARLEAQFFRANVDPSERYVLSLKGSTPYRLRAGDSGFSNLYLTGDWTQNDFNAGCVEATVMSGLFCSNAMTGYPPVGEIVGHDHA